MTEIKSKPNELTRVEDVVDKMRRLAPTPSEVVNHPRHYNRHPSGVECIDVVQHFNFNRGNAIKYIWRADEKGNTLEDLKKAAWYLAQEIKRLEQEDSVP